MKLKPPKTWQLIVILVTVFVLAIGGSFLAVYLTTGFKPQYIYPESIVVEDVDSNYNQKNSQYEVVENFSLKITSPTEQITNKQITLGFAPGKAVTRTNDGKISDGTIIVPEVVNLDQEFTVELVQCAYTDKTGQPFSSNVGGISQLVITTENNLLTSSTITIAVDVPVRDIEFTLINATTGQEFGGEGLTNKIAENTNFEIQTKFYPETSKYLFSDNLNDAITQKRQKQVFFYVSNAEILSGVSLVFNDGDVYFVAGDEPSSNNIINGYAFADAKQQLEFYESNSQISGLPFYSEAIRVLSTDENAAKSYVSVNVVEANVGSFTINDTSSSSLNLTANKLYRLSAGNSSLSDTSINIQIRDVHEGDLSSLIKNVGVRILTIDGVSATSSSANVNIVGGDALTLGEGDNVKQYILINSNVKNLNHAYWEISVDGVHQIVLEMVLITADENGEKIIFEENVQRLVYLTSSENVEEQVSWQNVEDEISMSIIYDEKGNIISSQFDKDLNSISYVPTSNIYQKKVFFAYVDESSTLPEGKTVADYVAVSNVGSGRYEISAGVYAYLYPLIGSDLIVKDAFDFKIVFATVRTDAYGNVLMTTSNTYQFEQISDSIDVSVEKTLQGLTSASLQIDAGWLNQPGGNFFAIPTGTSSAFVLDLTLVDGDAEIFRQEYALGKIKFYAAEDSEGEFEANNVFTFAEPEITGNKVSVQVSISNVEIEQDLGKDYYVCIAYNNSINTNVWVAEPAGDGQDYYGAVRVYNQTPNAITNSSLDGWTFDVSQTLNVDGSGNINITGTKTGEETVNLSSVTEFNNLINGVTDENGTKTGGMIIIDQYERQFEYAFDIVSSDSNVVGFSSLGGNQFGVTFGDGTVQGVLVTVRAGNQSFTFTINTQTTGITQILVDGEDQGSISDVYYNVAGKANEIVTLKDKLQIYVSGGQQYLTDEYSFAISQAYISSVDASLWNMFDFGEGVPYNSNNLNYIKFVENFGQSVSIPFVASNESGTLSFTFTLNISSVVSDGLNNLNSVDYGINGVNSGVREKDKPENSTSTDVLVYAGFKIDLNEYLKVTLTDGAFDWGNVSAYKQTYNLRSSSNDVIGVIETIKAVEGESNDLVGTFLTFNDVNVATTKTFTLYAYFDDGGNGNAYAYTRQLTVTILPNFELVANGGAETASLPLTNLLKPDGEMINNILELKRITENGSGLHTSTLGLSLNNSLLKATGYILFSGTTITLADTLDLSYGENEKVITVNLYDPDDQNQVIASCPVTLTVGVTIDDLVNAGVGDWLAKTIIYNGKEMILISNASETFLNQEVKNASVSIQANQYSYSLRTASGLNGNKLEFNQTGAISAGQNYYLNIHFSGKIGEVTSTLATIKVPILISMVGDQFASYREGIDDLKNIIEGTHEPKEIDAGSEYLLMAPSQINGKDYLIIDQTTTAQIALIDVQISGTNSEIIIDGNTYSIAIGDNGGISSFGVIGESPQLEITSGTGAKAGQTFVINYSKTYYVESIEEIDEGQYEIVLYSLILSQGANDALTIDGVPYKLEKGLFGWGIAEINGKKVLTALDQSNVSANITFAVPNQYSAFMSISTNQDFNVQSLVIEHVNGLEIENLDAYIVITQTRSSYSLDYNYNLKILPDGEIAQVVYPYNGSTSEFLEMVEGTTEVPTTETIDLKAPMGSDTEHNGEKRISDMFNGEDVSEGATLTLKEVRIGNDVITINPDGSSALDARFGVYVKGTKVTFKNISGQNITVVLERAYTQVYKGDLTYTFSINSQTVEYFIEYTNPTEIANGTLDGSTWSLPQGGEESVLVATTKQRTDVGESNVDPNRVTTTVTNDLPEGYTVSYDPETFTVSVTQPEFVPENATYHIYFAVGGIQIATLNVFVPATVTAEQGNSEVIAGAFYEASDLVTLNGGDVAVTVIEIVDPIDSIANKFVTTDATGITIENSIQDFSVTLKFTYQVNGNNGSAIFTYQVKANMSGNLSVNIGNVVAQEEKQTNLSAFTNVIEGKLTNEDWRHLAIVSVSPQDANVIKSDNVGISYGGGIGEDNFLNIKPEYVGANTPTTVTITFGYYPLGTNNKPNTTTDPLFTFISTISLTVTPAVSIQVKYPAPGGETLNYESLSAGEYNDFFNSIANFATTSRFVVTNLSSDTTEKIDYSKDFSFSVVEETNVTVTQENGKLTVERGTGSGLSYATIQIIYKGVMAQYTFYVFDYVITSTTNATINQNGAVETIYADRTKTSNLYGRNRLLELNIKDTASEGSVYSVYAVPVDENSGHSETLLTSFKMSKTYFNRTIYIDHGNNNLVYKDGKLWLNNDGGYEVQLEFRVGAGAGAGVEFSRLAGRVEYRYATNDGSSTLITSEDLTYNGQLNPTDKNWEYDKQATLTVTYSLNGITDGETGLKLIKQMDIAVENSYSEGNPTYIEVEAHKNSVYKLGNLAGITYASTGEPLTAESVANSGAILNVSVVNVGSPSDSPIKITGWTENGRTKQFVYQNQDEMSYLLFTNITGGDSNKTVYDFYLYAQGCAVDGDYALLEYTYTVDGQTKPFYIVVKIIPDYQVTIANTTVAEAGEVNTVTGDSDNYVSNKERPYEFTPDGSTSMMLASSDQTVEQLISVVRKNWNSTNIANTFTYKITEQQDGTGLNTESSIGKLNLGQEESSWNQEGSVYTNTGNSISITPAEVIFGVKSYMVEISDMFGYNIRFYFNLVPSSDQQPVVYEAVSTTTFVEGTPFDIGLVHDQISVQTVEDQTEVTVNPSQVPTSNDVSSIILQNIDAWGYTTSDVTKGSINGKIDEKYLEEPTFTNVTIENITFMYSEEVVEPVAVTEIKQITLGSEGNQASALPGQTLSYNGIDYTYSITDNGISLTTNISIQSKLEDNDPDKFIILNGHKYAVVFDDEGKQIHTINGRTAVWDEENEVYSLQGVDNIEFTINKNIDEEIVSLTFVFTANTVGTTDYKISLDLSGNPISYSIANASTDARLATDVSLSPLSGVADWGDYYRDLAAGNFVVPTMPGWIYGTSDSATVTITITLSSQGETCEISYSATITKNPQFTSNSKVIVDGEEFALGDYINIASRTTENYESSAYYDDTLLVIVPIKGQVSLDITFTENGNSKTVTRKINNTNTTRPVSNYLYLSEIYGKTLDPSVEISITWETLAGKDAEVWRHGTQGYVKIDENTETETTFNLEEVTNDTLYIENAGRIVGSDYYSVRKSYVIKVDGEYYQYRHDFYLTSRYTYFDDGLTGGNTVLEVPADWGEKDDQTGYTVNLSQWAEDITLYEAIDGSNGGLGQGTGYKLYDENITIDYDALRFEVARVDEADPNPPTAFFDKDGKTLYTGADYKINNNQYIRINIYVKASGGPNELWTKNNSYDKLLGFIIITLTGNEGVTIGDETYSWNVDESNNLTITNIIDTVKSGENVTIKNQKYFWQVEEGELSLHYAYVSGENGITIGDTTYSISAGNGTLSLSAGAEEVPSSSQIIVDGTTYTYSVNESVLTLSTSENEKIVSENGKITIGEKEYSVTIGDVYIILETGEGESVTTILSNNLITIGEKEYSFTYQNKVLTLINTSPIGKSETLYSQNIFKIMSNASTGQTFLQVSEIIDTAKTGENVTINEVDYTWSVENGNLKLTAV